MKKINKFYKSLLLIALLLCTRINESCAASGSEDFLRSTGKIYTVVAVIVVVLLGIAIYMYRIDNKLTKLENQINNEK